MVRQPDISRLCGERKQLLLKGPSNFAKGQDVSVDLMALDEQSCFWRWKVVNGEPLVSPTVHHCRLVFIANDRVVDDFAFIVTYDDHDRVPLLIGENHFAFAREWRKKDERE